MEQEKDFTAEMRKKYGEGVEVRTCETRAAETEGKRVVEGYAAVFNEVTDLGSFKEVIDPAAFEGRLNDDVRLLFNHEGQPLARTTNDTLELSTDEVGLKYRAELADTTAGRDLYELIRRGDVSQSSFAFTIETEERDAGGVRRVKKVGRLLDVAPVVYPAYDSPNNVVTSRKSEPNPTPTTAAPTEKKERKKMSEDTRTLTLNDLRAKRAQVSEELEALTAGIEGENRTAHDAEKEQITKYDSELVKLDSFIEMRQMKAAATARMAQSGQSSQSEAREFESVAKQYSLSRAISSVSNGRNLLGAELEFAQEAQNEMRSCGVDMRGQVGIPSKYMQRTADDFLAGTIGTPGNGGGFVPTISGNAIDGLRAPNMMEQLGVQFIQANGNLEFPRVKSNAIAGVGTEVATATDSTLDLDTVSLTPQRVNNTTTYSKQLLLQGGSQVDALITRELVAGVNTKMDTAAFKAITDDAVAGTPEVNVDATASAITNTIVNNLEKLVLEDGADLAGVRYVVTPAVFTQLRSLVAVADISAMLQDMMMNGHIVMATPNLVTSGSSHFAICGNFAQGCIGSRFGGLDVLVDPFSSAATAQTNLYVTQFWDFGIRQGKALAVAPALTA